MREGRVRANGLDFAYLEEGSGPLLLCLHGFPDVAWSWERQIPAFAAAGYRVVAPFLRGYAPTAVPTDGWYDRATLARDVQGLIGALGGGPAVIVGQDWGAAITYGAIAAFPELFSRAVVMAIPHPAMIRESFTSPAQVHRAFHWWFFQLPHLPEMAVAANDFAFIDYLWEYWSSPGHDDRAHIARVKRTLAAEGSLAATIGYYRAALDPAKQDPALADLRARLEQPIRVPTLALCGGEDIRGDVMERQREHFTGPYAYRVIPGCGHFLHRERPQEVTTAVLEWLATPV
jgi:pimeloyl-ACP methyl ester carboxylesterase